jgi:hypothetical protein
LKYDYIPYNEGFVFISSAAVAHNALPPAGLAVRAPESRDVDARPDDGARAVRRTRPAAPAHRDTRHAGNHAYAGIYSHRYSIGRVFIRTQVLTVTCNLLAQVFSRK